MLRYSKYFLQHALWLDDGFCQYFVQDDFWGLQEILDVQIMVFDCPEDAHQWLWQCAEHDYSGTLYQLRDYLAHFSQRPYILHRMNDRHVMRAAAEELSANMSRVVIQPYVGWAVQVDAQTDTPELPPRVEAEPELSGMLAELKDHLDALVIEQQRQYDKFEAHVAQMSPEQKALFYSQKAGGAVYDSAIGDAWEMVKAAPAVLWKAAKAFPGFYAGYLKTLWKVAQTPSKMAALTAQGITTGNYNPLKQEIDRIVTPVAMTYEQAVKYKSMLTVLFSDEQTHALLYDFAQRYYEATHPVELTQMAASAVADIVVTVILAIVTVGAGAAANVAAKSSRLVKVAKLLEKIAATLKRVGPKAKLLDKGHDAAGAAAKVEKRASKAARKKGVPDVERPKDTKKLDKKTPKEYGAPGKNDGPKKTNVTTDRLDKRHLEISQGISKRIGKSSPVQSTNDINQLFKQAEVAVVELKKLTDDIAKSTNGKAVYPPGLKTKTRTVEKINTDYGGDASKLLDISRSSISFESADDLFSALSKIDKNADIVRIKDRFANPAPGGYRDILVNIRQSNGHITALQLHSKQILDVKGGTGHKLYEQIRKINGKAMLENRPLSAAELKLQNSLVKELESLYNDGFESFLRN